jgi:hypothetical protein
MGKVKDKALEAEAPVETQVTIDGTLEAYPEQPEAGTDLVAMAQITVTQLPIIEERLRDVKAAVEATVAEAKSLVATADTVQAVKNRRAELNKQFDAIEDQRKAIKKQISAPYERFEAVYKECIAGPFREADAALKATVDDFQNALKKTALGKLEAYYYELCALEQIDWLTFAEAMEKSNIKIGLDDCKKREPKKAMDELAAFTSKIGLGLDTVRQMDDSAEILVEFKKCLDAGQAAAKVQERKRRVREAEEAEARRKASDFEARRQAALGKLEAITPTAAPEQVKEPIRSVTAPAQFPPVIGFKIYFETERQYLAVLPVLKQLKETLQQEGIRYGK